MSLHWLRTGREELHGDLLGAAVAATVLPDLHHGIGARFGGNGLPVKLHGHRAVGRLHGKHHQQRLGGMAPSVAFIGLSQQQIQAGQQAGKGQAAAVVGGAGLIRRQAVPEHVALQGLRQRAPVGAGEGFQGDGVGREGRLQGEDRRGIHSGDTVEPEGHAGKARAVAPEGEGGEAGRWGSMAAAAKTDPASNCDPAVVPPPAST